jgi:hypothetical protein
MANGDILRLGGISKASFHRYLKAYVTGSIEQLKQINHYRPQSQLASYRPRSKPLFRSIPRDGGGSRRQDHRADWDCPQADATVKYSH